MAVVVIEQWAHSIDYYHRTIDGVKGKRFECRCGWHSALSTFDADIRPAAGEHLRVADSFLAFTIQSPALPPKYASSGVMRRGTGEVFDGED